MKCHTWVKKEINGGAVVTSNLGAREIQKEQ